MSSQQERLVYLPEHFFYELLMLRYTAMRLEGVSDQLLWNALYESFGVHARNLYDFLRNENDQRNFKASDFITDFDCGKLTIKGRIDRMQEQIMHLGKRRVMSDEDRRININDVTEIHRWIEEKIRKFTVELDEPYKPTWKPDDADPARIESSLNGPAGSPSQSSLPSAIGYTGYKVPNKTD